MANEPETFKYKLKVQRFPPTQYNSGEECSDALMSMTRHSSDVLAHELAYTMLPYMNDDTSRYIFANDEGTIYCVKYECDDSVDKWLVWKEVIIGMSEYSLSDEIKL